MARNLEDSDRVPSMRFASLFGIGVGFEFLTDGQRKLGIQETHLSGGKYRNSQPNSVGTRAIEWKPVEATGV